MQAGGGETWPTHSTHPPACPPTADLREALGHGQQLPEGAEVLSDHRGEVADLVHQLPLEGGVAKVACARGGGG